MNSISAYLKGWGVSIKHYKMWGLLYVVNLIFALLLTFPIFQFLEGKLSHTLAIDKLKEQFDFTIFNDILNEYGDITSFLVNQNLVHSLLFLVLSVFLAGGILNVVKFRDAPFRFSGFWVGCSKYFWRILKLTLLFLVVQGFLLAFFIFLFNTLTAGGLQRFNSEAEIYTRAMILFPFYSFFALLFFMIQDYAKVMVVNEDVSFFKAVGRGIGFVVKHFFATFLLYLLNALVFGLLFYLYWQLSTENAVLIGFLIGQLFLLFRIGTKLTNLASATVLYDRLMANKKL